MGTSYAHIGWNRDRAKISDLSVSGRDGRPTIITVKISVSDASELGFILGQIAELKASERPIRKTLLLEDRRGEDLIDG